MQKDLSIPKPKPKPLLVPMPKRGVGRQAYEWALANGKSATAAAHHFNISAVLIQSHRRYYNLPSLADARVTSGLCKRVRRRNEEVKQACRAAYELAHIKNINPRDAAIKHGLTYQSLVRFCVRNKLTLPPARSVKNLD